ncbi:MAG: nitrite reductase small subunit NirD [Acidiferrobacterales bacterium]|nr:nitrite reductase small subunit NirD [Acidiferrobacterales bacterium]
MSKQKICNPEDLVKNSGVCTLANVAGQEHQIAVFLVPDTEQKVFAISNWDPLGNANVLSRGVIGNIGDELVVASPLYKQHFSLLSGKCLEDEDVSVSTFPVVLEDDGVYLAA